MAKKRKPTLWQALNEPVVEVGEGFAKLVFGLTAAIMFAAWIAPYWGMADPISSGREFQVALNTRSAIVAGAFEEMREAPQWYAVLQDLPGEVAGAFSEASYEVLDISDPALGMAAFSSPGVGAVKGAWLELMADPY